MRGLAGPGIVALAVWCAAGLITIATPDASTPRLIVPAAWWVMAAAWAAGALVPAWRRRPLLATPALLSVLPWLPLPLPPIALVWTGPLAWAPIAAALICAVGSDPLTAFGRFVGANNGRRSTVLAGVATVALCATVAWNIESHVPGGDEPHYLVITQSLLKDRDLRIENNHRQGDYREFFDRDLAPHYNARGRDGEIYSVHAPGLPVLVLPAFALMGYMGAKVLLLLLAGIAGALIWRIGWRVADSSTAAWFVWAAITGSAAFLLHAGLIFPDAPGALAVALAVLLLVRLSTARADVRLGELALVSVLLAGLPWLHTRFAVLSAGFGALIVGWLLRDLSRPVAARLRRAAAFLIVPCLGAAAWLAFFQIVYGTLNPAAPYAGTAGNRLAFSPGGLAGLLFDEQFGLLMCTPVMFLAGAGFSRVHTRGLRTAALGAIAAAGAYLAAVTTYWMWWAGTPAGPSRFAVAALPVMAVPLARAWAGADAAGRRICLAILAASWSVSAVIVGVQRGDLAWNVRDGEALWLDWLGPVVNLPRAWPSFFWKLNATSLRSEMPFAMHAAAWVAVFAVAWLAIRALGRRADWTAGGWRLALSMWLLIGVMANAQIGWWMNGVSGLDAGRSQMALLSAGAGAFELAAFRVRHLDALDGRVVVRPDEPGRIEGLANWLELESVPAGTYALHITSSRPRAGTLQVRIGRSSPPIRTIAIQALNRQEAMLTLPAGVAGLVLTPDESLDGVIGRVEIEPRHLIRGSPFARMAVPLGPANVFFFDDTVDVEPEGFWIRGGQAARMALERRDSDAAGPMRLTIQNGRGANEVVIADGGHARREALGSFETRTIDVPVARELTITSRSGFRPSDDGTSRDGRYLGVRVTIGN